MKRTFALRRRTNSPRRPRSYRPCLESLEDRCLLSDFKLGHLVQVSRRDPFADCTADDIEHQPGVLYPSTEVEPRLAVDPTDPNHLVGVFQQDPWANSLARGLMAGVSFDGGRRWREVVIPGLSLCAGGDFHRASDPGLSFAPNGDLYVSGVVADKGPSGLTARTAILTSKSTDGGLTWTAPATIDIQFPAESGRPGDDFPVIMVDPTDPQIAYVAFTIDRDKELFSRTTDGGRTWEPARILYDLGPGPFVFPTKVVIQPDGTLIDFLSVSNQDPRADSEFLLLRSTDRGQTWTTQPIHVATQQHVPVTDPDTGQGVVDGFPGGSKDVAGDPSNGNLYAVWGDGRFNGRQHSAIVFSMSTDGGLTWSEPIQINQTPTDIDPRDQQAFLPTIQVAADGTVGVTYYDFRLNDPRPGLATDYWFVHAHPEDPGGLTNPANWAHELRLTNRSFDLERAPYSDRGVYGGLFVGDYEGLVAAGNSFLAFWAQPHRRDPANIFSRQIRPGNRGHHRGHGHDDERQNGHYDEQRHGAVFLASSMLIAGLTDLPAPAASTAKARMAPVDVQRLDRFFAAGREDGSSLVLPLDEVRWDRFFAAGREEDGRVGMVRAHHTPLNWADDPWAAVVGSDDTLGDGLFPALLKD